MLDILVTYKEVSKDMLYYWVQELGTLRSLQLGFNVYEPEKSKMKVPHAFRFNNELKVVLTCPVSPTDATTLPQKRKKKVPLKKSGKKSTETKLFSFDASDDEKSADEEDESESEVATERSTSDSSNSSDYSSSFRVDFDFDRVQHIIAIALQLLHFSRKFPSYLHIFTWEKNGDPRRSKIRRNDKNERTIEVPPRFVCLYFQKYY